MKTTDKSIGADFWTSKRAARKAEALTPEQSKTIDRARGYAARIAQTGYGKGYRHWTQIPELLEFWDRIYVEDKMPGAYKVLSAAQHVMSSQGKVPKKYRI